jgi:hypothetical protein
MHASVLYGPRFATPHAQRSALKALDTNALLERTASMAGMYDCAVRILQ